MSEINIELKRELDRWRALGISPRFWLRDDDAISDTPELRRLLSLAKEVDIVIGIAVIPESADNGLVRLLASPHCCIWQHGWSHHWSVERGAHSYSQGEFGDGRRLELMMADAHKGQRVMDSLFGTSGWQRVFVPPFHALSPSFKCLLPSLGYRGVSSGHPLTPRFTTVAEVNTEIDFMNWPKRQFIGSEEACRLTVEQLSGRRLGHIDCQNPIGILSHHLALDEEAWLFMEHFFCFLRNDTNVELVDAGRLFEGLSPETSIQSPLLSRDTTIPDVANEVTMVITSCGRQDLLEITLDSFLKFNTYPIKEFVVIEDGDGSRNQFLATKYNAHPFKWLSTGQRVGQVAAIDLAYKAVQTEYIFHCEDDWEFYETGFLEKSLVILNQNPSILQVWIRALNDTNRHPVIDYTLRAQDVPFQLLQHNHDAGEWGVWHGLSWNPGLRRRKDYLALGSFGCLDPNTVKDTWRVECEAGGIYQQQGFLAAIISDNEGRGFVRHIGGDRRVVRNYLI